jgi:inosine/xanthosine triphosphatase
MTSIKVAVGSNNPVKVQATAEAFQEVFGEIKIIEKEVNSEVPDQPFGNEIIDGSKNRAKNVLKITNADFGVGIESGIMKLDERWYNLGFITITDKKGRMGTGTSGWFECPSSILEEIKKGKELGEVIDKITGEKNVKKQDGAIGILTKRKISRKNLYKHGVLMALIPFLSPELF